MWLCRHKPEYFQEDSKLECNGAVSSNAVKHYFDFFLFAAWKNKDNALSYTLESAEAAWRLCFLPRMRGSFTPARYACLVLLFLYQTIGKMRRRIEETAGVALPGLAISELPDTK